MLTKALTVYRPVARSFRVRTLLVSGLHYRSTV